MASVRLPAVAVLAAVALLTGCSGGSDESKDSGKIAGAEESEKKPSPTASSGPGSDDRPKIKVPGDLSYAFDWQKTGDKDKDAVLADTEQMIKAVDMAIARQDPTHAAYRFYTEGPAAAGSEQFIQSFVDNKIRITGTKRFYNAKAQVKKDKTASLVYCEDQRKAYNKSLKTGKTSVTKPSKNDFVIYASRLRANDQGVWVNEELTSQRGSAECQA
ncbi:hypothetical protein [Streptomyces sp. NPDC051776]|uniref:hypothetical protein n=1 Tax=Streptomyces sp. NPDC051776 TaxID=3155414 RepID=UPI00344751F5